MFLVGKDGKNGFVYAAECEATVCLAGISVLFSNYFVSHFTS